MTVKTNGAQFKRFYEDPSVWGEKGWCDATEYEIDGKLFGDDQDLIVEEILDQSVVKIISGVIFDGPNDGDEADMISAFKKWAKAQSRTNLVIEVEKTRLDEVIALLKSFKIKVVS